LLSLLPVFEAPSPFEIIFYFSQEVLEVFDFEIQKLILNVVCRDISFAKCQLIQHFKVLKIQSQYWILLNVSLSKAAAEDPSTFMLIEIAYLLNFSHRIPLCLDLLSPTFFEAPINFCFLSESSLLFKNAIT
jgi:hypothetical protein